MENDGVNIVRIRHCNGEVTSVPDRNSALFTTNLVRYPGFSFELLGEETGIETLTSLFRSVKEEGMRCGAERSKV